MPVPYTFGTATAAIPLTQLDSNFATAITIGNTAVYLGNTTTSIGNLSLANVTITSVSTPITAAQGGTGLTSITANSVMLGNATGSVLLVAPGTLGNVLVSTGTTWQSTAPASGGSVTNVSVTSANGFAGTVANPTSTPAITLTTSITGVLKGNGTAISAATAGTDYIAPSGALGTPSSGTLSSCTVDGTNEVGFKNIPQNSQSAAYTLVLADAGKHIFHPVGDNNARTFTIPANSSVAYPIGTAITFINMAVANVTIAITTDTLVLSAAGTTGSRTLATNGSATCIKITSTSWLISGSGLT
jgi:hypothetical protein